MNKISMVLAAAALLAALDAGAETQGMTYVTPQEAVALTRKAVLEVVLPAIAQAKLPGAKDYANQIPQEVVNASEAGCAGLSDVITTTNRNEIFHRAQPCLDAQAIALLKSLYSSPKYVRSEATYGNYTFNTANLINSAGTLPGLFSARTFIHSPDVDWNMVSYEETGWFRESQMPVPGEQFLLVTIIYVSERVDGSDRRRRMVSWLGYDYSIRNPYVTQGIVSEFGNSVCFIPGGCKQFLQNQAKTLLEMK